MRHLRLFAALLLTVTTASAADPVPIEKFTQASKFSRAQLSPDGRFIACLQEIDGDQWLIFVNLETKRTARVNPGVTVTGLRKEVSAFRWISDRRISFLTTVWDGQMFTGVSAVDYDGKRWVAFTGSDVNPYEQNPLLATQIIHSFADEDQNVLMLDRGSNSGSDLVYPDVIKVSTLSRYAETVVKNPGNVVSWVPDRTGVVRLGITRDGLRTGVIYRENERTKWRTLPLFDEERGQISPLGFDYDGQRLIVAATNEHKRRAGWASSSPATRISTSFPSAARPRSTGSRSPGRSSPSWRRAWSASATSPTGRGPCGSSPGMAGCRPASTRCCRTRSTSSSAAPAMKSASLCWAFPTGNPASITWWT